MGLMAKRKTNSNASTINEALRPLAVPLNEVHLLPGNPRRGDVGALAESLKAFGQTKPIIVQKSTMTVIGGNHLMRAAAALGWTEIAANVVDVDDDTAKGIALADNRMADLGDYDEAALLKMMSEVERNFGLEGTGYDTDDLDTLLAKVGTGKGGFGKGDPDASGSVPEQPWVEPGMMFQLGDHRIICGDGTDPKVLGKLLENVRPELLIVQPPAKKGQQPGDLWNALHDVPEQFWFEPHRYGLFGFMDEDHPSLLVWDKQAENTSRDFAEAFELIYSKTQHSQVILRHTLVGAADGEKHGGPDFNERPTALFMDLFERWSGFEGVILDPIALGATVLLAAEKSGRRYYGAKADPAHVQATLEKWNDYSGIEAMQIEPIGQA